MVGQRRLWGGSVSTGGSGGGSRGSGGGGKVNTYRPPGHHKADKISGSLNNKKIDAARERGGILGERKGKNFLLSPQSGGGIIAYIGTKGKSGLKLESYSGVSTQFNRLDDAISWARHTIDGMTSKK